MRGRPVASRPPSVPPRAGVSSAALDRGWRLPSGGAGRMQCTARARESATGFAPVVRTGKRSSCEPAPTNSRAVCWKNNEMHLVDWTGQVPRSGEKPRYRERFPPSFPLSNIKVSTQKPAEPALERGRCPSREWLEEVRLEQRSEPDSNLLWRMADARWQMGAMAADGPATFKRVLLQIRNRFAS